MSKYNSLEPLPVKEGDWSQLAALILDADIKDEVLSMIEKERWNLRQEEKRNQKIVDVTALAINDPDADGPKRVTTNMQTLALRMGATLGELQQAKDMIPEDLWMSKRWERAITLERIRDRASQYAEIVSLALDGMRELLLLGKVKDPAEFAHIIRMGEQMIQLGEMKAGAKSGMANTGDALVNLQINNINSSQPNGDLPGPGNLGSIHLTLSNRVAQQLVNTDVVEFNSTEERFIDSIDMLSIKELPTLLKPVGRKGTGESEES